MKRLLTTLCHVVFACVFLFSQKEPIKWGKIPDEDFQLSSYSKFPEAEGMVLCDYGRIVFVLNGDEPKYIFTQHRRVKIFNRTAFNQTDILIPYFKNSQKVITLKAQVFSPDGKVTEIGKKDVFEEKYSENVNVLRFALPNIQEGAIFEYKYSIESSNLFTLNDWYFQNQLPTRLSEVKVEMPTLLSYAKVLLGSEPLTVNDCRLNTSYGANTYAIEECIFAAEHLPGLKEEPFITTIEDYRLRMKFQLNFINRPGELREGVVNTWDRVAEELKNNRAFGTQYTSKSQFRKIYEATLPLSNSATQEEKVRIFSNFISKKIRENDGFNTIFSEKSLNDAFENGSSNNAERNLMLLALLREHNIEAYPVLLSTREHGKPILTYPLVTQFDHVIVLARPEGRDSMLLDIHVAEAPPQLLRINSLNGLGLLLEKDSARWIPIPPPDNFDRFLYNFEPDGDGTFKGHLVASHGGYSGIEERSLWSEDPDGKFWKDRLLTTFPEISISSISAVNKDDIYDALKCEIECTIPVGAKAEETFMYISPVAFSRFRDNLFKLESRYFPVDIPYPLKEQIVSVYKIPAGYVVDELPESVSIVLPNDGGKFQFITRQQDDEVQVSSRVQLNQLYYLPSEYGALKHFFDIVVQKMGEPIVLKKIQ